MTVLETFSGKLRFHDGTIVDSVLTISDDTLTVTADTIEVGTWPMKYCRASRVSDSEFELNIDGESTFFHPVDPYAFGKAAADRFVGSSIADRINVIRTMPLERMIEVSEPQATPPPPERVVVRPDVNPKRNDLRNALIVTAVVIALAAGVAWGFSVLGQDEEPIVTTTAAPIVENEAPDLFMSTPGGFQTIWNTEALDNEAAMLVITGRLGTGRFTQSLSDRITLTGDVDDDGTIRGLTLTIYPTADTDETSLALASMGIAIQIADPSLDGSERQGLLRNLGLNYLDDQMDLTDVNGSVDLNGIRYRLRFYDLSAESGDELLFSIGEVP